MISRKITNGIIAVLVVLFFSTDALAQRSSSSSGSTAKPPTASATPGKSYSSGNTNSGSTWGSSSSRPPQPKFDTLGRDDKFKADNRAKYERGSTPQSSYKTDSGQNRTINTNSKTVQNTRNNITEEKWVNRSTRINTTFSSYTVIAAQPTTIVYHDNFNSLFWLYMLNEVSAQERAMWYYNHRMDDGFDARRTEELRRKDAEFDARLKQLEGRPVNANYVPNGPRAVDEDLMYTDKYVESVYNPTPKTHYSSGDGSGWRIFGRIVMWTFIVLVVIAVVYFIFFYRGF